MKRLALVLAVILSFAFSGCGGGGGSPSAGLGGAGGGDFGGGGNAGGGGTLPGPTGTVTVRISGADRAMPLKDGAPPLPDWTDVRIIVQQEYDDGEGNVSLIRRGLENLLATGAGTATFTVPAGDSYTVVVLFTSVAGNVHTMLAYGKSDPFSVLPGTDAQVALTAKAIYEYINIAPPLTVTNGQTYPVYTTATGPVEQGYYHLKTANGDATTGGSTPFGNEYTSVTGDIYGSVVAYFTAPNVGSVPSGYNIGTAYENMYNLHFQGKFFANSSVLIAGENPLDWSFTAPNYIYNDPVLTHLVPDGGIVIDIEY